MRVKEEWKRPVKSSEAWKAIMFAILLGGVVAAFGPVIFHSRFERLSWAILLLALWAQAAMQIFKAGWRVLQNSYGVQLAGYTFFAGGNMLPHGTAASWLTNIGAALLIAAFAVMIFDFRKTKQPISTDTVPPM